MGARSVLAPHRLSHDRWGVNVDNRLGDYFSSWSETEVAKIVHCGLPRTPFEALTLVCQTIAPASFGRN